MSDERSPDFSTCRNCGEPIAWDDIGYTHQGTGFGDCGLTFGGEREPPRWPKSLWDKGVKAGVWRSGVWIDPVLVPTTDPALVGKTAEPVEWGPPDG